jgi:uncharacterized membrane protein
VNFIPPLHPICVHFAVSLSIFGLLVDWLGSVSGHAHWQTAGRLSFLAGVAAMACAVLSGWLEQQVLGLASDFPAPVQDVLSYHEYLGYGLLGFFLVLSVIRVQIEGRLPHFFVVLAMLGLVGIIVQGYLGGELVYRYGVGVRAVQASDVEALGGVKR